MKNIKKLLLVAGCLCLWAFQGNAQAALTFDGADDYVALGNPASLQLTFGTIEFLVKTTSAVTNDVLINKEGFYQLLLLNSELKVYDAISGNIVASSGINLANNAWRHVAMTFAPGANNSKLYVDGTLTNTFTLSNAVNTGNLTISSPNAAQACSATFDEFRIYSHLRTQAQIQASMNCELFGSETGLKAYYHFNQSSGTTLTDATINGNNGTLTNFPASPWVSPGGATTGTFCATGEALDFDGTDDYVTFPNTGVSTAAGTLECWFENDQANVEQMLIMAGSESFSIFLWSDGKIYFRAGGTQVSTPFTGTGIYHHAAMVWNGSVFQTYLDGVLVGSGAQGSSGIVGSGSGSLGKNIGTNGQYFNGRLDETRVWNVARTQYQIQASKSCELPGPETGLIAYYRFNQSSGTSLSDLSGNNNNGTLTGFTFSSSTSNWSAADGVTVGNICQVASISGNPTGCGSTILTANGGASYVWSTGATTAEVTVTASGTYTVTATFSGGTTGTASQAVTIYTPLTASISGTTTACDQVGLTASGGTNYAWSNGTGTAAATFTASGTYTVTATDANGCTASASQAVTVNKATASISGAADGCDEVMLTASGGTLYNWTGGSTSATPVFSTPDTYSVTATDANGCTGTAVHTIFAVDQSKTYYLDADGDGYGDSNNPIQSCSPLAGYLLLGLDCDDTNPDINPGASEDCDNVDNNCNGILIEENCPGSNAPVALECSSRSTTVVLTGKVFFNYGSFTNARNTVNRSSSTIGQPCVGMTIGDDKNVGFGFWMRFLLSPSAPTVVATQGELPDRIQIEWSADPLSPAALSYKIYRDNALLATVDNETFAFIDFNVLAGQFYTYEIAGTNQFGEGQRGSSPGFLNPNGVVTGQIKTFSGNPVLGAVVKLSPTLGAAAEFNGLSTIFTEYEPEFPRAEFTLSCWVKQGDGNDGTGIFDFGSSIGKNWWLHTLSSGSDKGVKFGIGKNLNNKTELAYTYPGSTKNDWHYVAASFNGSSLLLYVDGELVETAVGEIEADSTAFFIGKHDDEGGYFTGKIDELRFFDRQLPQTEIQMVMNQTVSGATEGLVSYWKFDEGSGSKAFDLTANKTKAFLCGATWTSDKPNVVNAGISDETGFYKIEGVNYGAGTTFTATPSKSFYFNQSLEFNAANDSYAELTNFDISDSTTIEVTVKNFDFSAAQTLLSKQNGATTHFDLSLNAGNLILEMGGSTKNWGAIGMGFQRLSFVLEQSGGSTDVTFYKNGTLAGTHTFSGADANFSDGTPWTLGAKRNAGNTARTNFFTGLIDEAAFFETLLPLNEIQTFANIGTNNAHPKLRHYFNLNEGSLTALRDMGTALTGYGSTQGATWSTVASIVETLPHEFIPSSRLVTLTPSNTSADQIDFTDQSTISVSGYVRFQGTDCFQKRVEILVNGQSHTPTIFTDGNGKFTADFEPGATVRLSPKFEDHTFSPPFWDLTNLSTPVAGILFRNQTKRKVVGQVAGNEICRKSVIPDDAIVKVKVATLNGCFEQIKQLPANGKFVFDGVPPDSVTVAVIEHSNPVIYTFFQNKGGATLDLRMKNDTTDFIYLAPPNVEMTMLDTNFCGDPILNQGAGYKTKIKVYEQYDGGKCYLDTAMLTINNTIGDLDQFDTLMLTGELVHQFKAGLPNIVPPHNKILQVSAEAHDEQATLTQDAIVLGIRARQSTFASTAPEIPTLILRDPPGDASSAYIEKGNTNCVTWSFSAGIGVNYEESLTAHLLPDFTTSVGLGAEVEAEIDNTLDIGLEMTMSFNSLLSTEGNVCMTTTEVISTGDNDLVVGSNMGGDVYMGGAMNYLFGITDDLKFDSSTCSVFLDKGLTVFPDGFATTFIYSEYHILNVVIPQLELLGDMNSADRWRNIVALNNEQKANAVFIENRSFDAGIVYESSTTTETSNSITAEFNMEFSSSFVQEFGVTANGAGISQGSKIGFTTSLGASVGGVFTNARTVGYTLADDDIGDNFSVNVKQDKVYGTPVFDLVAGQSQCPHEPNTQPRESVSIQADAQVAVNVPKNDVAVFKLILGNTSQSEEVKFYTLEGLQENNPDGAVIRFNGQAALNVGVPFGQPVEVTMTVARGPVAFDYENLRIGYFSDCEVGRADFLGIDPPAEQNKELEFDVYFLEPCSPVEVGFPLADWVHLSTSGTFLNITINDYNVADADLELVRVQYRRSQGDGAWINIAEIPKADLGAVFEIVQWNLPTSFKDGFYEIRAVTQCFSGALNPGISKVVKGKIEREAPEIFGTPEPADGVYSAGDEISVRFNEDIRCDLLIQADIFDNNNVGLYNTRTGNLVDAVITCSGDKITLVPNVANQFIENDVLRVEIDNIKDLAGNNFVHGQWEFVNDRNNLNWVDNVAVYVSKYEEEIKSVTRRIENRGGFNQSFEITGGPIWARIYPKSGTLAPGAVQVVTFEFDSTLVFGNYVDTITLKGALGDEPLDVQCRVVCKDPGWAVNPADWDYSMNMTVRLDIEGTVSNDVEDIVAAYVGTELRGVGKIQYLAPVDKFVAFLTIYSDQFDGETVEFRIWDASECLLYGQVLEGFSFEADGLIGTPQYPQTLHTNNMVLREIELHPGWNWISFNLAFPDNSVSAALASVNDPGGDLIKTQVPFSLNTPGFGWLGSLATLQNTPMYQYRTADADTIVHLGALIDPASVNIPISAGWNWIGYLPQQALTVNEALASLTPLNGDIIKSQSAFAQYVAGFGWLGNLVYMSPPNGYLLKMAQPGVLTYPNSSNRPEDLSTLKKLENLNASSRNSIFQVDATKFEHSQTLIAMLENGGSNVTGKDFELGAFVGNECRGAAKAIWVEPLQAHLFFQTIYSNTTGELLKFKFYDGDASSMTSVDLSETMYFSADAAVGTVQNPFKFSSKISAADEPLENFQPFLDVLPNPIMDYATIRFRSEKQQNVFFKISDATGRLMQTFDYQSNKGMNAMLWEDAGKLPPGVYLLEMTEGERKMTEKIVVR